MSESMMPLTLQMSTLVSSGGHHRTGPQSLENDIIPQESVRLQVSNMSHLIHASSHYPHVFPKDQVKF